MKLVNNEDQLNSTIQSLKIEIADKDQLIYDIFSNIKLMEGKHAWVSQGIDEVK